MKIYVAKAPMLHDHWKIDWMTRGTAHISYA
jgi:hypothetical protein